TSRMALPVSLVVQRDSVCAGDDCDAPHELKLSVGDNTLRDVVRELLGKGYLASIAGGRATWILEASRPLAVLAQQWEQPRFLVDPEAAIGKYISRDRPPDLRLRYWCQVDPDKVFECLRDGRPLPDRYESSTA